MKKVYTEQELDDYLRRQEEKFIMQWDRYKKELLNMGAGKIQSIRTKYGSYKGPVIVQHQIKDILESENGIIIELADVPLPDTILTHRCEECRRYLDFPNN